MKHSINHFCSFWSQILDRELCLDLTAYYKQEEIYLGVYGYAVIGFDCWEITDVTNEKDLTHIKLDKEFWPCLENEILAYLENSNHLTGNFNEAW